MRSQLIKNLYDHLENIKNLQHTHMKGAFSLKK